MNEFSVITIMNEATINVLKSKKVDCSINLKIKEYLKDEALFFRVSPQRAYEILSSVGVKKEQLENTYKKLVSQKIFYELLNKGKIKEDDNNIIIRYATNRLWWYI